MQVMASLTSSTLKRVATSIKLLAWNVCVRIPGTWLARVKLHRVNAALWRDPCELGEFHLTFALPPKRSFSFAKRMVVTGWKLGRKASHPRSVSVYSNVDEHWHVETKQKLAEELISSTSEVVPDSFIGNRSSNFYCMVFFPEIHTNNISRHSGCTFPEAVALRIIFGGGEFVCLHFIHGCLLSAVKWWNLFSWDVTMCFKKVTSFPLT
jgi:hypothetical protein